MFMVRQCLQAAASDMLIFSGLSLLRRSNGEKLSRFKIAVDTLITFAGEFFTGEIKR